MVGDAGRAAGAGREAAIGPVCGFIPGTGKAALAVDGRGAAIGCGAGCISD